MDSVTDVLLTAMASYAQADLNGYSYLTQSRDGSVLMVVSVATMQGRHFADTNLVARVVGTQIIIDHDVNTKPLVDVLLGVGVPRGQIVLAYPGEVLSSVA